jgi:hypothetical protein
VDLLHNAAFLGHVTRESGVISWLVHGNIHVVPVGGFGQPATILVCPCRGVGNALALFEQGRDGGSGVRVEVLFCKS